MLTATQKQSLSAHTIIQHSFTTQKVPRHTPRDFFFATIYAPLAQADKRTLIHSVLIHGICNLKDGTRAALLKRHRGYDNRLKCHSEEQSDVGIP
nr:MAG TPA: hypothetical protein [Bacteriophage sp.]